MDLICLGELLIDMFPAELGRKHAEVSAYRPVPGGAPANVAVARPAAWARRPRSSARWAMTRSATSWSTCWRARGSRRAACGSTPRRAPR